MSEDFTPLMEYVTVASRSRDKRIAALEEDANNQHDLWLKEKDKSIALEAQISDMFRHPFDYYHDGLCSRGVGRRDDCPVCAKRPDPGQVLKELEAELADLEVHLELKQSIILADETKMILLKAELNQAMDTIRELEAALAKAEEE